MNDRPTLLLEHHLKDLKLPSFLREYGKMAAQCAAEGVDHPQYLLRLAELELIDRHQRMVERRIRAARSKALYLDFGLESSLNDSGSRARQIDRHQRMVERRIRAARFPAVKSLDSFDFPVVPSLNKALVMELARC